jgi:hypothetical protein
MRTLNKDYKSRNEIIFGDDDADSNDNWLGGTRRFDSLNLEQLHALIRNEFIDLEDCQNYSPSVGDFLDFMKKYPEVEAHGYAVSHKRDDYRVSLEGIRFGGKVTMKMLLDFVHLCRHADEFHADEKGLYAWWD